MDKIDVKILACVQQDGAAPMAKIAEQVGLSHSACWRRVERLEADGVIQRRVALLDPSKVNVKVTVFVSIRTNQHSASWAEQFCKKVSLIPEVVEFYRMSGTVDYLIKVVVPDISAHDSVYKKITSIAELFDVSSGFAMEQIKYTTTLPLTYVRTDNQA
jgi:Lrp/AsnC family transcriptional regulator